MSEPGKSFLVVVSRLPEKTLIEPEKSYRGSGVEVA